MYLESTTDASERCPLRKIIVKRLSFLLFNFIQLQVCHLQGSSFYLNNQFRQKSQHNYRYQIFGSQCFIFT